MGSPGADEQDRGMSSTSPSWRERYRQAARDAGFLLRLWPTLVARALAPGTPKPAETTRETGGKCTSCG